MKCALVSLVLFCSISLMAAATPSVKVLYNFPPNGLSGATPNGALVFDTAGNLYGETTNGGATSGGVVFELTPSQTGWQQTVLHTFTGGFLDGFGPSGGLAIDANGNLYGTTESGGSGDLGVVFELSPVGNGQWTEKILYNFTGQSDGGEPLCQLIMDGSGNIYGTAAIGGNKPNLGTVFELSPSDGTWIFTVLYDFTGTANDDGANPHAGLSFDASGNIYGTTLNGGRVNRGTVFELQNNGGLWTESVLTDFGNNASVAKPISMLAFDMSGNLYGTLSNDTALCSTNKYCGAVFEMSPTQGGGWTQPTYIHQFNQNQAPKDGAIPFAGVVLDSAGRLYGTTQSGGTFGKGMVFQLTADSRGFWNEASYSFCTTTGACPTGSSPDGPVILDSLGNVYGTTTVGGSVRGGLGTVFQIVR